LLLPPKFSTFANVGRREPLTLADGYHCRGESAGERLSSGDGLDDGLDDGLGIPREALTGKVPATKVINSKF